MVVKKTHVKSIYFSKKNFNVIKALYRSGVISNFYVNNNLNCKENTTIIFSLFFYKNVPFFSKLTLISTASKLFYISYKTLKLSTLVFKNSIMILSTKHGLLNTKESLMLREGGEILYILH